MDNPAVQWGVGIGGFVVLLLIFMAVRVVREYERGVIFRLGRLMGAKGPGLFFIIPFVDQMIKVDLRIVTLDVPEQDVITRDNVPVKVNAVVYYRVMDPNDAIVKAANFHQATWQIAQTTLRSVLGQAELDHLLAERDRINESLQQIIDAATDAWGVKVTTVEVKDVNLPADMQRAIARQAEAERERRAKVINAEGEYQAAQRLLDAAQIMAQQPMALQLRFLQTLVEVATENNTTTIFPVPIDLLKPFVDRGTKPAERATEQP